MINVFRLPVPSPTATPSQLREQTLKPGNTQETWSPAQHMYYGPPDISSRKRTAIQAFLSLLSGAINAQHAQEIFDGEMAKFEPIDCLDFTQEIFKQAPGTELHRLASIRQKWEHKFGYHSQRTKVGDAKSRDTAWLDEQWGGPHWLPSDVREANIYGGTSQPTRDLITEMMRITHMAKARGINLYLLWSKGGALREEVSRRAAQKSLHSGVPAPTTARFTNKMAKFIADGIADGTIPPVVGWQGPSQPLIPIDPSLPRMDTPQLTHNPARDRQGGDPFANYKANFRRAVGTVETEDHIDTMSTMGHINDAMSEPGDLDQSDQPGQEDLPGQVDINHHERPTDANSGSPTRRDDTDLSATNKRTFDEFSDTPPASYEKYKTFVANLNTDDFKRLHNNATKDLAQAEAEKAAADFALGNLEGREDQIREIQQQSETNTEQKADKSQGEEQDSTPSEGNTISQGILTDIISSTGKVFLDGINRLRDSLIQPQPEESTDISAADRIRQQHAKAVENLAEAKKRVSTLDHIEKARFMQDSCNEMRDYRCKIRILLKETEEKTTAMEKAYPEAFDCAEEEGWASFLAAERKRADNV